MRIGEFGQAHNHDRTTRPGAAPAIRRRRIGQIAAPTDADKRRRTPEARPECPTAAGNGIRANNDVR